MEKDYTEFDERVDKFLAGEMSSEEERSFYETLEADEELKERALTIAATVKEMEAVSREKEVRLIEGMKSMSREEFVDAIGKKVIPFTPGQQSPIAATSAVKATAKVIPLWRPVFKYAAVIAVLVSVGLGGNEYYANYKTATLGGEYYAVISDNGRLGTTKGVDSEIGNSLASLYSDVEKGEHLSSVIPKLEMAYELSLNEDTEYYDYKVYISWNLAMAYLKDGNRSGALKVLRGIVDDPDNDGKQITKQASDLIKKITAIKSLF